MLLTNQIYKSHCIFMEDLFNFNQEIKLIILHRLYYIAAISDVTQ